MQTDRIVNEDIDYIIESGINWDIFGEKNIFITGGYGMLLPYITYVFLRLNQRFKTNIKIILVTRNPDKALRLFGVSDSIKYLNHNLLDEICLHDKIDFIFHGASPAIPSLFTTHAESILFPNIYGTYNVLELARKKRVKAMLYFSSGAVYGLPHSSKLVRETDYGYLDPLNINNVYGESKRMAECMCASWSSMYGVPVKIVRPAHIYGPTMDLVNDRRIVATMVNQIINGRDIVLKTSGDGWRSFCYIADATTAFFKVMLHGEVGGAYNVGNDKNYMSIRSLAEIVACLYGKRIVCEEKKCINTSGCDRMLMVSEKISRLGWSCRYDITEGLEQTVQSYINRK